MPMPPLVDSATRRREIAIWQGAGASVVAKVVSAGCLLAQVPLAVGYLGAELFGLWMTLTSVLSLMAFADFGIGAGVQNEAAHLLGKDRAAEARKTFVNGLAVLGVVGLSLAIILSLGCVYLPWDKWIGIHDPLVAVQAHRGLLVLVVLFSANLPLTSVARLAFGLHLSWLANVWYAVINLFVLIAVAAATVGHFSFAGFLALAAVPPVLGHLGMWVHLFRKLRWGTLDLPRPHGADMRRLFKAGLPFTLPQVSGLALNAMPPVLISAILGPAMVTPWNMGQRLLGLFGQLQGMLLAPLWPAYAEARSRGEGGWLKKKYRHSVILSGAFIALPQLLFAFWGQPAIRFWSHDAVSLAWTTAAALGFWSAISSLSQPPAFLLNGFGRAMGQGIYGGISVAIILAGAPMVLHAGGLAGLATLAGVVFAAINLPCVYVEAHRAMRARSELAIQRKLLMWLCRLVSGVRRLRARRYVPVVIYKVDRLGDFVLAIGAIRIVVGRAGAENVLLVLSEIARPLAEREFPEVEKYYVRYDGEGARAALRAAWSNPLARGTVRARALICLRHQGGFFRRQLLAGLMDNTTSFGCTETNSLPHSCAHFSRTISYPQAAAGALPVELRAHAMVVEAWTGAAIATADLVPVLRNEESSGEFVLICPFGSSTLRDYPDTSWIEVVRELRTMGRPVLFNAGAADHARIHSLAAQCDVADVAVTTDFAEFFALICRAMIVVTVETAAAHLATALDKSAVVLIGGGHFGRCGPWTRSARQIWLTHEMVCFGCDWSCVHEQPWCVREIPSRAVIEAVSRIKC